MTIRILLLLYVAALLNPLHAAADQSGKSIVCSLYALITNPDAYSGKHVRTEGVIRASADGRFCIYPNRDDYEAGRVINSIDLAWSTQDSTKKHPKSGPLDGKNAIIDGLFLSYNTSTENRDESTLVLGGSPYGKIELEAVVRE